MVQIKRKRKKICVKTLLLQDLFPLLISQQQIRIQHTCFLGYSIYPFVERVAQERGNLHWMADESII
jgi:hypothetical protein